MSGPGDGLCPPRKRGGDWYVCGQSVRLRDPRTRREDRCPGGLFVCVHCARRTTSYYRGEGKR